MGRTTRSDVDARRLAARLAALAALVSASTSCVPFGSVQSATTVGKGNAEFAAEPGVWGVVSGSGTGIVPRVDLALRYGVSESADIGVRFGSGLLELQSKFRLTPPGSPGVIAALAPSLAGIFVGAGDSSAGYMHLALPVLLGFGDPEGTEVVIGPRLHSMYFFGGAGDSSGNALLLLAGSSFGAALRLGDRFRILPEITLLYPFYGATSASSSEGSASGGGFIRAQGLLLQGSVGFLFEF